MRSIMPMDCTNTVICAHPFASRPSVLSTNFRHGFVWPAPIPNRGHVFATLPHVAAVFGELIFELLTCPRACGAEPRHALDCFYRKVEAVELVEHHHVKRCCRCSFLLETAHMHVGVIGALV